MKTSRNLSFLFPIFCTLYLICNCQEHDHPDSRSYRFSERERSCNYQRQEGVCRKRSDCKRPTRQVCRFSLNPIICCLDEPTPLITTTTKRPRTTKASVVKPASAKEIDLTYPGCGSRHKSQGNNRVTRPRTKRQSSLFPTGIFSRGQGAIKPVIVGGVTAERNSWPWMVAIFKSTNSQSPKRFLCGASLISRKYVLTAAHCFDGERGNIDPSKFYIMVGAHTTNDGLEYPVRSILIHPNYKQRQYYNDISIIRLAREITLTENIYPVCLPSDGLRHKINPQNNDVTVTGWGDTSFGGVSSKVLQELTIPIVPLKQCNASYSKIALANFPQGITNLFICAGVEEGGKDACQGDSGGPLVSELKDKSWVQLGVVSFGYGCAQAGYPGVYTRVSKFTKWLYENTDLGKI